MNQVALITANLGSFDAVWTSTIAAQTIPVDLFNFTDQNFPLRSQAMTPRLQAKIPKMFGWELCPGYDFYIWLDANLAFKSERSAEWFVSQLEDNDIAMFVHPERDSILKELAFMENLMRQGNHYLVSRYSEEWMGKQVLRYLDTPGFKDYRLFAGGAFIYRNNEKAKVCLETWFTHCCRWSLQDQLSFPFVSWATSTDVNPIKLHVTDNPYLQYHPRWE